MHSCKIIGIIVLHQQYTVTTLKVAVVLLITGKHIFYVMHNIGADSSFWMCDCVAEDHPFDTT